MPSEILTPPSVWELAEPREQEQGSRNLVRESASLEEEEDQMPS
jgi:hypothetical protein